MPLPHPLVPLIKKRHFWNHYFFGDQFDGGTGKEYGSATESGGDDSEDRNYPGLKDCIDFPEPEVIGWDDQAHWLPHVLRWQELDLICRCTALDDPTLPHPGIPLLLLHRFAPLCLGEESADRSTALGAAWRSLGIFSEGEIVRFVRRFDHRDHGFRWIYSEPEGWTIDQERRSRGSHWLYTARFTGSETFPFEHFNSAIEDAHARYARAIE